MAKLADDVVLDAALNKIKTATRESICSASPANFAGIAAISLGNIAITPGTGTDFSAIADGTTGGGRKITINPAAGKVISSGITAGTATHIVLDDGSQLLYQTTCTSQALTAGSTVTIPQWSVQIADPT